jgi:hypothetical protein
MWILQNFISQEECVGPAKVPNSAYIETSAIMGSDRAYVKHFFELLWQLFLRMRKIEHLSINKRESLLAQA